MSNDLVFLRATELAQRLRDRELSAREVMQAHLDQIAAVNPKVNAIVTQIPDDAALALADAADERLARGEEVGPLHGLPIAHKDLEDTAGIRTTYGSPIYADHVPTADTLMITRLKQAGSLTIGKTNVPEWGAGSHSFNPVFGATLNPWDTTRTGGGSSGGAAVALATGMVPIADGSDMGGSLRNPGNFNNVVGFRPSPGRVPVVPGRMPWIPFGVHGPLARTVEDTALLLSAMAGPDHRVETSLDVPGDVFRQPLQRDMRGVRVAFAPDLGELPLHPHVRAALDAQRAVFEGLGCIVEDAVPDLQDADRIFRDIRAFSFATGQREHYRLHKDQLKDTVVWNVEEGQRLSAVDVGVAMGLQSQLYARFAKFMDRYEYLICAVNQVPPFDATIPYPTEIDGVQMETYIAWMKSAYYITVTGAPCISVPAAFTPDGLPVGVQIVGRRHADFGVLQMGYAFQEATELWKQRPPVCTD